MSFDGHDDSAEAEHDEAQWSEEFKSSSEIFPEKIIWCPLIKVLLSFCLADS